MKPAFSVIRHTGLAAATRFWPPFPGSALQASAAAAAFVFGRSSAPSSRKVSSPASSGEGGHTVATSATD